ETGGAARGRTSCSGAGRHAGEVGVSVARAQESPRGFRSLKNQTSPGPRRAPGETRLSLQFCLLCGHFFPLLLAVLGFLVCRLGVLLGGLPVVVLVLPLALEIVH